MMVMVVVVVVMMIKMMMMMMMESSYCIGSSLKDVRSAFWGDWQRTCAPEADLSRHMAISVSTGPVLAVPSKIDLGLLDYNDHMC
jgi:hypothetical protein